MSTIAPPPKPINPVLVDSEGYIDEQISRTRRSLKLIDLAAGLLTLMIGLLGFILIGAVIDHWIVPGGLGLVGRSALFVVMLLGLAWYGWRQFLPLLKPINPVYAAQTIERNTPTLKNSLLNLLLFRSHRDYLSARVYHALEQQTAVKLSSTPLDASIDRSALLRLGYALVAVIAVFALYAALSPKSLALSTGRVLAPWSELTAPSRVQILDVKPGKTSVARGERVEVSAEIHGLNAEEPVRLRYSTADEQTVDESIRMERPTAEARRYEASLPRGTDGGVMQDLTYWIEAGDARTRKFKLSVFERPTIIVRKVRYDFPPYTGLPTKESNHSGDLRGVEGTRVTIGAIASQPIKTAWIDFDGDGTNDLPMDVSGDRAMKSFTLALRDDRRTPLHPKYAVRFTTADGRTNADPPLYSIEVTPDYAPEVRITEPEAAEQVVRPGDIVPIGVEARDPDFGLKQVSIVGKVDGGEEQTLIEMIEKPHTGRFGATRMFTPADAGLKAGDVLEYWAVAHDTRPESNVAYSEHRRLKVIGPDKPAAGKQQAPNQKNPPQDGEQNGDGGGENGGQAGGQGGQGGDSSGGGEGQPQPGSGGSSGDKGESGQQNQQGQGGAGGESGDNNDGESNNDSSEAGENGAGGTNGEGSDQSAENSSSEGNQKNQGSSGGQQTGDSNKSDTGEPGQSGDGGGEPSAGGQSGKVSSAGDDDAQAFQQMMEHLKEQNQGEPGAGSPQQQPGGQAQQSASQQGGEPTDPAAGEQAEGGDAQQNGGAPQSSAQQPEGQQQGDQPPQ